MSDSHTFVVATSGVGGNDCFATRHAAVGEKAILESLGIDAEVRVRQRYATDPV